MRTLRTVLSDGFARCIPLLFLFTLALAACEDPAEVRCEPGTEACAGDPAEPDERSIGGEGLDLRPGAPSLSWTTATQTVPPDFVVEQFVNGFDLPTDIEFLPDGRVLVAELGGTIRMVDGGAVLPTRFLNFVGRVNKCCNRGLLGIAADPDWPTDPYVYLLYSYDPPEVNNYTGNAGPDGEGHRVSRLTRVTADASNNYETIVPGSEVVIAGANSVWANIGDPFSRQTNLNAGWTCYENGTPFGTPIQDCIPADGLSHSVGTVAFGPDGSLYFSNGDAASYNSVDERATRSLEVGSMTGKVFRIDPTTGQGLPSNPYWDGDPNSNASKVFQMGLRNPYRFTVDPNTGLPWIGDVGWVAWEELNNGPAGADFGWPCYEGGSGSSIQSTDGYQNLSYCQSYYTTAAPTAAPYGWYRRGTGGAALGGPVYTGNTYPAEYQGAVFFGDYVKQWMKYRKPDGTVVDFADGLGPMVDLAQGPDGNLYYLHYGGGAIYRFLYTGDPPVNNGLVLHLPFDEGSGIVAADQSGQGNDGTLNGPTWVGSPLGAALDFDGVDDLVEVPSDPTLDITDEVTLAAWINVRSYENWEGIITKGRTQTTYGLNVWGDGTIRLTANWGSPAGGVGRGAWNSLGAVSLNTWHHVAATYDGQNIRFYIDGVEDPRVPDPVLTFGVVDEPLTVGGDLPGQDEYLDGAINDVRVYNRALDATEISDLAQLGGGNNPPTIQNPGDRTDELGESVILNLQGDDPDGDFLFYSATGLPSSLQLRPRIGEIAGPLTEAGIFNVTVTVTDGVASASESFVWTVDDPGGPGPLDPALWLKLDEGSGTLAADSSGYENDGTVSGAAWTTGQSGGALDFDGVDDLVTVPSDPSLDITDELTLTAWVKVRSFENWEGIITKGTTKTSYGLNVWGDGTIRLTANWGSPTGGVGIGAWNSTLTLSADTWHHVAATYDGQTIRFYVDGVEDSRKPTPTLTFGVTAEPLTLGGDLPGVAEYLDGSLDDARVYPRALSASEVQTLFNGGRVP